MKLIQSALLLSLCPLCPAGASEAALSELVSELRRGTEILEEWSENNRSQTAELVELAARDTDTGERDSALPNSETWERITALNQNHRLLLAAAQDSVDEYAALAGYLAASERSSAWRECLASADCSFREINEACSEQTIALAEEAEESARQLQENLAEALEELDGFSGEARDSAGLNSTLDTLSKVSALSAGSLISLSSQISSLVEITARSARIRSRGEVASSAADARFWEAGSVSSEHLSVRIGDRDA